MNYAIFRSEPIMTLSDLSQIGSHNKREKQAYKSNPDIKIELSSNNIELVPLSEKYNKKFYEMTKEYKKQHDERMKTERTERKRTFNQMLNKSKSVVADELVLTATHEFFDNMSKEDVMAWADTCMDFVYNDLGYTKEQILHATVHMDEKTPHIHCVVVPLVKKMDKRTNTERFTISKKQYIKDKHHLSELQDKYHERLISKGFELERGIKNSDNEHINIKVFKKITRKLNLDLNNRNLKLSNAMQTLETKMSSNKEMIFDKEHIKIKKDTFDSMNKVIAESKKVMEMQPKIKKVYDEIDNYATSYKSLERQNDNIKREVNYLKNKNEKLEAENENLMDYIKYILSVVKDFFRDILLVGNKDAKDRATVEIKDFYDNEDIKQNEVYDIAIDTDKEQELFDYADIERYYKKDKSDDFDMGR